VGATYDSGMSEEMEIRVNFGKPMPVFPLAHVALMPHAVLPMHIFEPRYRRMVADALDGAGQIALAVFEGEGWRTEYEGRPAIRSAVCVGQIVQHQKMPDGRYDIALHGVCRGRVIEELPEDEARPYRMALLEPVGVAEFDETELAGYRERFADLLTTAPLSDLKRAARVVEHLKNDQFPTTAIMELVTVSILHDSEARYYPELHYSLLAEGDPVRRAALIERELGSLNTLLTRAASQRKSDAPRGCSWN